MQIISEVDIMDESTVPADIQIKDAAPSISEPTVEEILEAYVFEARIQLEETIKALKGKGQEDLKANFSAINKQLNVLSKGTSLGRQKLCTCAYGNNVWCN